MKKNKKVPKNQPISKSILTQMGLGLVALVVFGFAVFLTLPIITWCKSSGWTETPCVIIESGLIHKPYMASYKKLKSGSVHIYVKYHYEFGGNVYIGYYGKFGKESDTSVRITKEGQNLYPVNSKHTCYVNPNIPEESTFLRQFPFMEAYGLSIMLLLIVVLAYYFLSKKIKP